MFLNCLWGSGSLARIVPLNRPESENRGDALVPTVAAVNPSIDQNSSSRSRVQGLFNRIQGDPSVSDNSIRVSRFYGSREVEEIVLVSDDRRVILPLG